MHLFFAQLFPFVFAGVILGTFIHSVLPTGRGIPTALSNSAGDNPPPGVVNVTNNHSRLIELLVRVLTTLRDIISDGLSTTSDCGIFPQASATAADPRTKLLSIARMHGWTGLEGASSDGLSMLGPLRNFKGGIVTVQRQVPYLRRFIGYSFFDILSRRNDTILSPGVLSDLARTFTITGDVSHHALQLNGEDIGFMLRTMLAIADLVCALISRVENEQDVRIAFGYFIEDPTSWALYTRAYGPSPSVEHIVRLTHRGPQTRGPSFRTLVVGPPRFDPTASAVPGSPFNSMFGHDGASTIDVEQGTGLVTLRDPEIEYFATLFVASYLRFYGTTAVDNI